MKRLGRRGQSITEYALVMVLIVTIITGMELYMRRRIQAVIRVAADELGVQEDARLIDPEKGEAQKSWFTTVRDSITRGSIKQRPENKVAKKFEIINEAGEPGKETTTREGWSFSVRK